MSVKQNAKQNLLWLIDTCIEKGGIFKTAQEVANLVNSVEIASANDEPAERPAMIAMKGTASEQIQARIDNQEQQQ